MARNHDQRHDRLTQLIRDSRNQDTGVERLSAGGRDRVLGAAWTESPTSTGIPSLFLPIRRWTWAVMAPTVALAFVFGSMFFTAEAPEAGASLLSIEKRGGQVIFNIANGGQPHRVYRSSSPQELADPSDLQPFAQAQGSFRDSVQSQAGESNLVFYRID
ncbi:MAG: hypothetical protein OEV00_04525 [Acidobacteriota bacterium]|nr:hypothetical protein [Acidobacteriota bacterium]MDH3784579.1 hypothetical protein [Acidobacteriota bacterium]